MSHDKGESSWDKPKWNASNMRIGSSHNCPSQSKGQFQSFNNEITIIFISKHDGPSTLDSISAALGFLFW